MNVGVKKFLIAAAYVALYLSCETSAAAIGTEGAVDSATTKDAPKPVAAPTIEGGETTNDAPKITAVAAKVASFKCGTLNCPNGVFCEDREIPSYDQKKVTKTTRCRDADGEILDEKITTEDVADGDIPFTTYRRKVVTGDKNGSYFGSSSSSSFSSLGNDVFPKSIGIFGSIPPKIVGEKEKPFDFDFESAYKNLRETQRKLFQLSNIWQFPYFGTGWW